MQVFIIIDRGSLLDFIQNNKKVGNTYQHSCFITISGAIIIAYKSTIQKRI